MKLHITAKTLLGHFPFSSPPTEPVSGTKTSSRNQTPLGIKLKISFCRAPNPASSSDSASTNPEEEEDPVPSLIFEKLKDAERQQINKVGEHDRNTKLQIEMQLVMASCWNRIDLSEFLNLINSNDVKFMEYSSYGQSLSGTSGSKKKMKLKAVKNKRIGSLGKSWSKSISPKATTDVSFDDFAGQDYIKKELQEIVRILRNDEEFKDKGIYCPKGVLLHGPPGTGKTLLAKAIAGESGLPFFAANGTEFVEMFQSVVASRVKDLFDNARSCAPSIIFIDEIDAIGSKRGGPDIGGGSAVSEQGLLQILAEMDGFKLDTSQVLVVGATNRLDSLDPALSRKGRFDKIIRVGLPIRDGRLAILKLHARNKYFRSEEEKEVLLEEIADLTEDFTGSELQNILNEAGILTARKGLDFIGRDELLEALERQKGTFETGHEDSTELPEDLKLRLAYREAAVVVLACYFPDPHRPIIETHINSIRSEPNLCFAKAKGEVFSKKSDYVNSIIRACAPRAIEEEIFGIDNLCWMSEKATLKASRLAEILILQTGMTAFGKAYYRKEHNDIVPNLAPKLQALQDEYIRYAMEKCSAVLREFDSAVETITDILLDKGKIDGEEIWDIYRRAPRIPQPPVTPIDEYGALVYAGRWGIHGVSLPGRVTFAPGNIGFATFGAPRPGNSPD